MRSDSSLWFRLALFFPPPCFLKISISLSYTRTPSSNFQYMAPSYEMFMRLKAINYLSSWSLVWREKEKEREKNQECFILLSVSNGLMPVQKSAELQGNFITRSSTSLKVATERRSRMRHYPFLPVGRKWLGVSGHIWSFAARGRINSVYGEAFHRFLQIFSKCWMKRLWFSTHLMDR